LDGHVLYPSLDSFGQPTLLVIVLAIIIFTLGAASIPLLFIEEKEAHTLDALLVSPAGLAQVVVGKALAGATCCLLAAGILAALSQRLFVHWEAAVLAIVLTTFFSVAVGLLVGILSDNPTTVGTVGSLLLILLMALTALNAMNLPALPEILKQALAWLPGAAALNLFQISIAGEAPAGMLWANAGALLAAGLAGYLLVYWRISRVDR
jgi:ABC-2 type transport system permease protein